MFNKHQFKKSFGQNFLRNGKFTNKLAEALQIQPDQSVIEIGPGEGVLTNSLLKVKAKVIAVEIDYSLIPNLIKRFGENKNFEIINEDILHIDFTEALDKFNATSEVKAAGSLPYNISKKIIKKFEDFNLEQDKYFVSQMAFIVQDEVAKEYASKAPKASLLSNYINLYADVKKLESIPASQFFPQPRVNGAILLITPKKEVIENAGEIYKFMRLGFSAPRKTLLKNLKNSNKWDKEFLIKTFSELEIKENARAAEIENEKWVELYEKLN